MLNNPVKQKLLAGDVALGTMIFEFDSTGISRIAGHAGAEFLLFDMEHTGWSIETIRKLIATTQRTGPLPFVRVPASDYQFIARTLDVGAAGLMFPMVQNREQAEKIVDCAKYPPVGRRGAAFGVAHDHYGSDDIIATMQAANEQGLIIAQIETRSGLENVEAIAAVQGIDVVWIGQFDLSNSLGIPAQFDHPDFQKAVDRVLAACKIHDKAAGYMAFSVEEGKQLIDRGFRSIAFGGDLWLYQQALRTGLTELRSHADSKSLRG